MVDFVAIQKDKVLIRFVDGNREYHHTGKLDKTNEKGASEGVMYFFTHKRQKMSVVAPNIKRKIQVKDEKGVWIEKEEIVPYPYIIAINGQQVIGCYNGSTIAPCLYGEYISDPNPAVTTAHITHMMSKNVKTIHKVGSGGSPILIFIIIAIIIAIVGVVVYNQMNKRSVTTTPISYEIRGEEWDNLL